MVTPDQRFAYVTNTIDKTIAEYSNSPSGRIRLLGTVPIAGAGSGMAQFPTDIAISRDGRYVYTIVPSVFAGNTSFIEGFKVSPLTGKLTFVTATDQNLPIGISGLAAPRTAADSTTRIVGGGRPGHQLRPVRPAPVRSVKSRSGS